MVLPKNGHIVDNEFYCEECVIECENCGEYIFIDDAIKTADSELICQTCKDNYYYVCDDCGEVFSDTDIVWIKNKEIIVCEKCLKKNYYKCECCNEYFSQSDVYETYDNNWVCSDCYYESYSTCEECGLVVHQDCAQYSENLQGDLCPNCYENNPDEIYNYHEFQNFSKLSMPDDDLYHKEFFGLEIEVSGDKYCAKDFLDMVPDVVLMQDASIHEGFEIVSMAMSRNYISNIFLPNLEKGIKYLQRNDFRACDEGGIHIHVSQEIFTKEMLCVLRNVLYSENEEDFEIWKTITQRCEEEIQDWCNYIDAISCSEILDSETSYPKLVDNRYTALNYDKRTETYEFRIFNSSTRIERIKKNIETVYSLIDYAKYKALQYKTANTYDYIEFIKQNNIFYPELYLYLCETNILKDTNEERTAA